MNVPDINFDCPACDQNIDAPLKMAGMKVYCPNCRTILQIPYPAEVAELRAREQAKVETVPIHVEGGIPPDPEARRIVIKRVAGDQG